MKKKMIPIKRNYAEIEDWARKTETRNITPPSDPLMKLKFAMCNEFNNYMIRHHIKQKDLADILKVTPNKVSDLANFKLDNVSFEWIFNHLLTLSAGDPIIAEMLKSFLGLIEISHDSVKKDSEIAKKIEFVETHDDYSEEFEELEDDLLSA